MKNLLTAVVAVLISCAVYSQDATAKVIAVYGEEAYAEMASSNPGQLELLSKYSDWGLEVVPSNDKYDQAIELQNVPLRSKSANSVSVQEFLTAYNSVGFNPLMYGLFPSNEIQVFKLQGVDFAILIQTQQNILSK
jgi:hypothetical protein